MDAYFLLCENSIAYQVLHTPTLLLLLCGCRTPRPCGGGGVLLLSSDTRLKHYFFVFVFVFVHDTRICLCVVVGEFDPGSGRTLAACLTHASRTERPTTFGGGYSSGERVSNTWVICPALWDKPGKLGLIPDTTNLRMGCWWKALWSGFRWAHGLSACW